MTQPPTIRPLTSEPDHAAARALEAAIWSAEASVPTHLTLAVVRAGGVLLGAFQGADLVAFAFGFVGLDAAGPHLVSHSLGVDPAHRGRGVGEALKRAQRAWAQARGLDEIRWTFDPMRPANAHLNLRKLGAVGTEWIDDAYGALDDAQNAGARTDRIVVAWRSSPRPSPGAHASVRLGGPDARDTIRALLLAGWCATDFDRATATYTFAR
jgi:predicted GNAT superfamily acetyltransferase